MQDHDEARRIVFRFVHFEKHTRDYTGNRMKKAVEQSTVFQEKVTEFFVNGKNTMAMLDINKLKRHGSSAVHGIFVTTGMAKTAVAAKGNKFKFSTMGTTVHGTAKRRIAAVDHLINIFREEYLWNVLRRFISRELLM